MSTLFLYISVPIQIRETAGILDSGTPEETQTGGSQARGKCEEHHNDDGVPEFGISTGRLLSLDPSKCGRGP